MNKKPDDALQSIEDLLGTPHPPEDMLSMFARGKMDKCLATTMIKLHLTRCQHCMELAYEFGWPASNTKH